MSSTVLALIAHANECSRRCSTYSSSSFSRAKATKSKPSDIATIQISSNIPSRCTPAMNPIGSPLGWKKLRFPTSIMSVGKLIRSSSMPFRHIPPTKNSSANGRNRLHPIHLNRYGNR